MERHYRRAGNYSAVPSEASEARRMGSSKSRRTKHPAYPLHPCSKLFSVFPFVFIARRACLEPACCELVESVEKSEGRTKMHITTENDQQDIMDNYGVYPHL